MPSIEELTSILRTALNPSHLEVLETGNCGESFSVVIVSDRFDNVKLLDRHRMVNDAIGGELMGMIHALSIKAKTPSQWANNATKSS
jgi:stress-induced morphogen